MTLKTTIIAAVLAFVTTSSSCRTSCPENCDNPKLSTYDIRINKNFDAINVANNIALDYTVGNDVNLTLYTPEQNRENVIIKVEKNTLILRVEKKSHKIFNTSAPVKIKLTAPTVGTLTATNNADISIAGTYQANSLNVTATNNAEVTFKGTTAITDASLTATNNADIMIPGAKFEVVTATATNNAEITLKQMEASSVSATATNNADVNLSGTGDKAVLTATNNAEISAGALTLKSADCSATNLAEITVNAASVNTTTHNKGSVKNKR